MIVRSSVGGALAVVLAAMTGLVVSCAGDDSGAGGSGACAKNGNCPNSAPPTPSEMQPCLNAFGDPKCGGLFASYFDCAAAQEKCTAGGVTDDNATRAAIATNCAPSAAAYRSCAGSVTQAPQCGLTGLACCTDGSPPCASTGCCDPATNECVGLGTACSAAKSVCAANKCGPCGAPGEPCCAIFGTSQPNPCPGGGCCNYAQGPAGAQCIAEGGMCDAPGPNTTETVCNQGSCITCGSELGLCCAGGKCNDPSDHCSGTTCVR